MKAFKWNKEKDNKLKRERGISFEDVINAKFITAEGHKKKLNQMILLFEYDNYVWAVPCVEEKDLLFLKTAYPSRKYTKQYLMRGDQDEKHKINKRRTGYRKSSCKW